MEARELRSSIEAKIEAVGLTRQCDFLDGLKSWDDLDEIYRGCDVLILPARFSNGNFTILEAASGMGLVVSQNVMGNGALIEDGVNGYRCEAAAESLANKMTNYAVQPRRISEHA